MEVEKTKEKIAQLHKSYIDLTFRVAEEMNSHNMPVEKLRGSVVILPPSLQDEYENFVKKLKPDIDKAKSVNDILYVVGDYLNYSLLEYLISMYGNSELKKEMTEYVQTIGVFRKETNLMIFSEVCKDKPKRDDGKFPKMITKHTTDWATATLEKVEEYRKEFCWELSLYKFSLKCVAIARGCVEITWLVPSFLVDYIQKSVKPSSPTMMKHHVTTLTIDEFIAYDSTTGISLMLASFIKFMAIISYSHAK